MNISLLLKKIKLKSRWLFNDLRAKTGWKGSPVHPFRRILVYHGIDERGETKLNSRFLSRSELRKQFEWFREECQVVSLDKFFAGESPKNRPEICLTFDDGYRNNFTEVLPLLEEFEFPATFFVTAARTTGRELLWTDLLDLTAYVEGKPFIWQGERYYRNGKGEFISLRTAAPLKGVAKHATVAEIEDLEALLHEQATFLEDPEWEPYWKLMDEAEVQVLAQHPLVTLGVHGTTHCSLDVLDIEAAMAEMKAARTWLVAQGAGQIDALSWPTGRYTPELVEAATAAGFSKQLAVDFLHPADAKDPRQAQRLVLNPHISFLNQREAVLKGSYL